MKKIHTLLALVACAFAQLVFANSAIVTSVTGTVTAQSAAAPARTLRQGDEVMQGTTVATGSNSSAVLRFSDGQIAALTANSQMAITSYAFDSASGQGNVLLSLVRGGMRAITGLIGKAHPQQVAYRAATATIGIRGTDVSVVVDEKEIIATVNNGEISFTYEGKSYVITGGESVRVMVDGKVITGPTPAVVGQVSKGINTSLVDLASATLIAQINAAGKSPGGGGAGGDEGGDRGGNGQGGNSQGGLTGGGGGGNSQGCQGNNCPPSKR